MALLALASALPLPPWTHLPRTAAEAAALLAVGWGALRATGAAQHEARAALVS